MLRFGTALSTVLILILVGSMPASARQQQGHAAMVTGTVADADGSPLAGATAVLHAAADSAIVVGAATGPDGSFLLEGLAAGGYWLRVSFVGMETFESDPFALSAAEARTFPTVTLAPDAVELEQINVEGERELVEVQPDKTVLNVQGTINATGSTGLELLKKSPGVIVDNNDNIIVAGKNGVRVYIDGKPSPLSTEDMAAQLRAMQASEIDAIEIITNPGAKFDAEGNAGIINIRLRRDSNLGFNSTLDLGYRYGKNSQYNASSTFNYRTTRINSFGSYAFNGGDSESWINLYRIQNDVLFDLKSTRTRSGPGNRFRIGNDVFIGPHGVLGVLVTGYVNDSNWINASLTPITDLTTNETEAVLDALSDNDGVRRNVTTNANYRWDNRKGITYNVDVDAGFYHNGNASFQPNFYRFPNDPAAAEANIFTSRAPTDIEIYAAKVDHERPVGALSVGLGAKVSQVTTDNSYRFFQVEEELEQLDVDRSNDFVFTETIAAGYATVSGSKGRVEYSAGLRGEYTDSKGELTAFKPSNNNVVIRGYLDVFPSGGITWQAAPSHQVRLNYSRRIDRPSYQSLNPFEFKLDELSFQRGNPFLQPQYTHSTSLTHTYDYVLNTTLTYSHTSDFFANISDSTDVSRTVLETINMDFQRVVSGSVSYPYSPTNWWSTFSSATAYNTRNRAELDRDRVVDISVTVASLYHQSQFKLPRDWSVELSGWFSSPSVWGAVYRTDTNYSIDAGVRKRFMQGRADLKVALTDVFKTAPWRGVQDFSGFFVDASGGWESRQLRVNLSYIFGNSQVKKSRDRQTGTADEARRVQ